MINHNQNWRAYNKSYRSTEQSQSDLPSRDPQHFPINKEKKQTYFRPRDPTYESAQFQIGPKTNKRSHELDRQTPRSSQLLMSEIGVKKSMKGNEIGYENTANQGRKRGAAKDLGIERSESDRARGGGAQPRMKKANSRLLAWQGRERRHLCLCTKREMMWRQ